MIAPEIDALRLATTMSLADVKAVLSSLRELVQDSSLRDAWNGATVFGLGPHVGSGRIQGTTMSIAPIGGVGFLSLGFPEHVEDSARAGFSREQQIADLVARELQDRLPFPIAARQVLAEYDCSFEVAFRCRIAYAIGFRSLMLTADKAAYSARITALLESDTETIRAYETPDSTTEGLATALSWSLNVLARLRGALAYKDTGGTLDDTGPTTIPHADAKARDLESQVHELSAALCDQFNDDGRAAVNGLLAELQRAHEAQIHYVTSSPRWGVYPNTTLR